MTAAVLRRGRHLVTTKAAHAACEHCGASILAGLAEGVPTRVDAVPLPLGGEPAAHAERRWTYTLTAGGELVHRDASRIAAGSLTGPVHADHRCAVALVRKAG